MAPCPKTARPTRRKSQTCVFMRVSVRTCMVAERRGREGATMAYITNYTRLVREPLGGKGATVAQESRRRRRRSHSPTLSRGIAVRSECGHQVLSSPSRARSCATRFARHRGSQVFESNVRSDVRSDARSNVRSDVRSTIGCSIECSIECSIGCSIEHVSVQTAGGRRL